MTGVSEDNIQCITERVKQLLKELFAAHVELTAEAKKWKKRCQKNKSNETCKGSPSLFDVSTHSSSFFDSPLSKDKAEQSTITTPSKLSNCKPGFFQKSSISRNEITVKSDKSHKTLIQGDGANANDLKRTDAESFCIAKTNKLCLTSTNKMQSSSIQKSSGETLPKTFDNHNSERDLQSPEPFIPSWKRRELTRPPLVVPDTEPNDYEDFKTSTPNKFISKTSRDITTFKLDTVCSNSPKKKRMKTNISSEKQTKLGRKDLNPFVKIEQSRRDSSEKMGTERSGATGVAENLREFISPSPDKKPLKNHKSIVKQPSLIGSCKIKQSIDLNSSPRDDALSFFIQTPKKHKNSIGSKDTIKRECEGSREQKSLDVGRKLSDPKSIDVDSKALNERFDQMSEEELQFSDSFDPDETYCPIMREKEMLSKQKDLEEVSSLNNASMMPGLRLSQYCTMDPDQTMDPNLRITDPHSAHETSSDVEIHQQLNTSSSFPSFESESQDLIAFNPVNRQFTCKPLQQSSPTVSNVNRNLISPTTFIGDNAIESPSGDENEELTKEGEEKENTSFDNFKEPAALDDSFNRIPSKNSGPEFAYVDVVRKKNERYKLDAFACEQCKKWYDAAGLTEEEKKERMKSCRHRSKFEPTSTPEHYWSLGFPDTEACKERGYVEIDDNGNKPVANRARRKRAYRKIF